jgi:Ulp1 family protease
MAPHSSLLQTVVRALSRLRKAALGKKDSMEQFPITKPILNFISKYSLKPQKFLVLKSGKGSWQ